jgi:hypothetical protein
MARASSDDGRIVRVKGRAVLHIAAGAIIPQPVADAAGGSYVPGAVTEHKKNGGLGAVPHNRNGPGMTPAPSRQLPDYASMIATISIDLGSTITIWSPTMK